MTTNEGQQIATDWLQRSINVSNWTKRWKIKINSDKSVHNIALRIIVAAYRYDRNDIIQRDMITSIHDKITKFASKHEKSLGKHTNPAAIQLVDISQDIRRLLRQIPYDLV
ncbi:Hypothetical protein CINCED_3A016284 [Cinara cedri]|uniref:Uncharacterized protein n=1 Tax=Cinara cedri TaxID=506608 RepID=A0A5E4MU54_9HEMI|nr:Hypothetical protein CINCED_3A016284 [Cinara cedri]